MAGPPSGGSAAPPPYPAPSPPRAGGGHGALIAVIAVVIVVVVILGLGFANVIPGFHLSGSSGGGGGGQPTYAATFTESGLATGTSWSVTLGGNSMSSTSSTLTFSESNGSYPFTVGAVTGYDASPSSGTLTVAGAPVNQPISFSVVTMYSVTYTETGLPAGQSWSVTLAGTTASSTGSTVSFQEPNGSYSFSVGAVSGYTASPASGITLVTGQSVNTAVTFTSGGPTLYAVTFAESGLPSGTNWSVTLGTDTQSSTTGSIVFQAANGNYPFTVGAVSGYTASPASGTVAVSGAPASEPITFTSSGGGGSGVPYSQAKPIANSVASSHDPSAVLVVAEAFVLQSSATNSTSGIGNASCSWSGVSSITVSATSSAYSSGNSDYWLFVYEDYAASTVLLVQVSGTSGTLLGTLSGSGCGFAGINLNPMPSNVIDSTQATAAVASNASAFLSSHSTATAELVLLSSYTGTYGNYTYTSPPLWEVTYTTCTPGSTGSGDYFDAEVNASSGAVFYSSPVTTTDCANVSLPAHGSSAPAALGGTVLYGDPALMPGRSADPALP